MSLENYTDLGLSKIINSNLINEKQIQKLSIHSKTLSHVYLHKQIFRTKTEMEMSVLNDVKFPTMSSKYWQACRELDGMFKELISTSIAFEENQAKLELSIIELNDIPEGKRKNSLVKIQNCKIKRIEFELIEQKLYANDRIREIDEWCKIMKKCTKNDPSINIFDPDEHQSNSYQKRFEEEIAIALQSNDKSLFKSASMHLRTIKP